MCDVNRAVQLEVFGRDLLIERHDESWRAYYLGNEGKRRPATDIVIPADVREADLVEYIADLCHEWATNRNNTVQRKD